MTVSDYPLAGIRASFRKQHCVLEEDYGCGTGTHWSNLSTSLGWLCTCFAAAWDVEPLTWASTGCAFAKHWVQHLRGWLCCLRSGTVCLWKPPRWCLLVLCMFWEPQTWSKFSSSAVGTLCGRSPLWPEHSAPLIKCSWELWAVASWLWVLKSRECSA